MPIYEYQCCDCQHKMEVFQKISDNVLQTCPECHQDTLVKLISAVAFQLKGTGWYETDFKNNQKNNNSKPSEESDSKPSEESDSQPDKSGKSEKTKTSDSESITKSESKPSSTKESTVTD